MEDILFVVDDDDTNKLFLFKFLDDAAQLSIILFATYLYSLSFLFVLLLLQLHSSSFSLLPLLLFLIELLSFSFVMCCVKSCPGKRVELQIVLYKSR